MAKVKGPLLSLGARGRIAGRVNFQTWKGRPYARSFVKPRDRRTVPQAKSRDTFLNANNIWDQSPALVHAPSQLFAKAKPFQGLNKFVGMFMEDNLGEPDMKKMKFSPGVNAGPVAKGMDLSTASPTITVDFTNPSVPPGWTLESAIAAAVVNRDPTSTDLPAVFAAEDTVTKNKVVLSGLQDETSYIVGAWLKWLRPDGKTAYGPSLQGEIMTPGSFSANAVHFDGINDNLLRGGALTGAADNETLLQSIWFNMTGKDGSLVVFSTSTGNRVSLRRLANGKIILFYQQASPLKILLVWQSTAVFDSVTNPGWHNLLIAADFDVTPTIQVYLDDAILPGFPNLGPTQGNIDWLTSDWGVGSDTASGSRIDADLAEFYATNETLDISLESNRRKFIDGAGKPVPLGDNGELPTGTDALILFSGSTDDWHTNKGTGGGFTEVGALTTAPSSPSD